MDYDSYVHTLNREVKLIMRSLQGYTPGGGISDSETKPKRCGLVHPSQMTNEGHGCFEIDTCSSIVT